MGKIIKTLSGMQGVFPRVLSGDSYSSLTKEIREKPLVYTSQKMDKINMKNDIYAIGRDMRFALNEVKQNLGING